MPGKHGRNRLENYLQVHESYMATFREEGFVVHDGCAFTILGKVVLLEGTITCLDGIVIEVRKEIDVLSGRGGSAWVRTRSFCYHAGLRGGETILRYDSPHGHRPYHHKHTYDTFGDGRELAIEELRSEREVPTLGEVIRELQGWHQQNAAHLARQRGSGQ
ncbi:MAG: hypothetical protein ACREL5_08810 [Gemmatimonadales bacterium]